MIIGSASEIFLLQLMNVNNVIIMGTNTDGCMVAGAINGRCPVFLPKSGLDVYYGQQLMVHDRMKNFDTDGIMPDIISRGDALDDAVSLIQNNK